MAKTIDAVSVTNLLALKTKLLESKASATRSGRYCECEGDECSYDGQEAAYDDVILQLESLLQTKTVSTIMVTRK